MPKTYSLIDRAHKKGDFSGTSLEGVKAFLNDCDNVVYHPGFFPDSAREVKDKSFCFVYIDADLYRSIRDSLEFFYERVVPGGVMMFDDYQWEDTGVKQAVEEFLAERAEVPIIVARSLCVLLKL